MSIDALKYNISQLLSDVESSTAGQNGAHKSAIANVRKSAEELEKPLYAVGCSVLLTNNAGQLLLAKRKNNSGAGLLSTPGGRVEFSDNSVLDTAVREFKEECGADIITPRLIGWRKLNRFGNHYFMFYVHSCAWSGNITNCIPDKSEDWAWFDVDGLGSNNCTEPGDIIQILLDESYVWRKTFDY